MLFFNAVDTKHELVLSQRLYFRKSTQFCCKEELRGYWIMHSWWIVVIGKWQRSWLSSRWIGIVDRWQMGCGQRLWTMPLVHTYLVPLILWWSPFPIWFLWACVSTEYGWSRKILKSKGFVWSRNSIITCWGFWLLIVLLSLCFNWSWVYRLWIWMDSLVWLHLR